MNTTDTEPVIKKTELDAEELADLMERISKLAARGKALGLVGEDLPAVHIHSTYQVGRYYASWIRPLRNAMVERAMSLPPPSLNGLAADLMEVETRHMVSVSGLAPRLSGWRLLAVMDRVEVFTNGVDETAGRSTETMIRRVPETAHILLDPARFNSQTDSTLCDHCGRKRRRVTTYVLSHSNGEVKQVGSSCLKDFLGHNTPAYLLALVQFEVTPITSSEDSEGGTYWSGGRTQVIDYVVAAMKVIDKDGFTSSKNQWKQPTKYTVRSLLEAEVEAKPSFSEKQLIERYDVTSEKYEDYVLRMTEALRWARELPLVTDFNQAVNQAARVAYVSDKVMGVLAYLPVAHERAMGVSAEYKAAIKATSTSTLQGEEGERFTRTLTVVSMRRVELNWGVSCVTHMRDSSGNYYEWWSSNRMMQIGERATCKATVSRHKKSWMDQYTKEDTTVLIRVSPIKGEDWVMTAQVTDEVLVS